MSTYVYFDSKIKEHAGFKSRPYKDSSGDDMKIFGENLFQELGGLRMTLGDGEEVPEELMNLVQGVSLHENIACTPARERGIYRHQSAEGEVDVYSGGRITQYAVKIRGKELADVRELYQKIRVGTIRPETSYDGPQGGKSRTELEKELERASKDLRVANQALLDKCNYEDACSHRLRALMGKLQRGRLPFCLYTKGMVIRMIERILAVEPVSR